MRSRSESVPRAHRRPGRPESVTVAPRCTFADLRCSTRQVSGVRGGIHEYCAGTSRSCRCACAEQFWLATIRRRKHKSNCSFSSWCMFPSSTPKELLCISPDCENIQGYPAITWFKMVYPLTQLASWPSIWRPVEILQVPGDVVFVPNGWWYAVLNLDITIAVTHVFCSRTNFRDVWKNTAADRPQISRGWLEGLKEVEPELYKVAVKIGLTNETNNEGFTESRIIVVEDSVTETNAPLDNSDEDIAAVTASNIVNNDEDVIEEVSGNIETNINNNEEIEENSDVDEMDDDASFYDEAIATLTKDEQNSVEFLSVFAKSSWLGLQKGSELVYAIDMCRRFEYNSDEGDCLSDPEPSIVRSHAPILLVDEPVPGSSAQISHAIIPVPGCSAQIPHARIPVPGCSTQISHARIPVPGYSAQISHARIPVPGCSTQISQAGEPVLGCSAPISHAIKPVSGCSGHIFAVAPVDESTFRETDNTWKADERANKKRYLEDIETRIYGNIDVNRRARVKTNRARMSAFYKQALEESPNNAFANIGKIFIQGGHTGSGANPKNWSVAGSSHAAQESQQDRAHLQTLNQALAHRPRSPSPSSSESDIVIDPNETFTRDKNVESYDADYDRVSDVHDDGYSVYYDDPEHDDDEPPFHDDALARCDREAIQRFRRNITGQDDEDSSTNESNDETEIDTEESSEEDDYDSSSNDINDKTEVDAQEEQETAQVSDSEKQEGTSRLGNEKFINVLRDNQVERNSNAAQTLHRNDEAYKTTFGDLAQGCKFSCGNTLCVTGVDCRSNSAPPDAVMEDDYLELAQGGGTYWFSNTWHEIRQEKRSQSAPPKLDEEQKFRESQEEDYDCSIAKGTPKSCVSAPPECEDEQESRESQGDSDCSMANVSLKKSLSAPPEFEDEQEFRESQEEDSDCSMANVTAEIQYESAQVSAQEDKAQESERENAAREASMKRAEDYIEYFKSQYLGKRDSVRKDNAQGSEPESKSRRLDQNGGKCSFANAFREAQADAQEIQACYGEHDNAQASTSTQDSSDSNAQFAETAGEEAQSGYPERERMPYAFGPESQHGYVPHLPNFDFPNQDWSHSELSFPRDKAKLLRCPICHNFIFINLPESGLASEEEILKAKERAISEYIQHEDVLRILPFSDIFSTCPHGHQPRPQPQPQPEPPQFFAHNVMPNEEARRQFSNSYFELLPPRFRENNFPPQPMEPDEDQRQSPRNNTTRSENVLGSNIVSPAFDAWGAHMNDGETASSSSGTIHLENQQSSNPLGVKGRISWIASRLVDTHLQSPEATNLNRGDTDIPTSESEQLDEQVRTTVLGEVIEIEDDDRNDAGEVIEIDDDDDDNGEVIEIEDDDE